MNERTILLVEDNPDDVALTLRAFNKCHIGNEVVVAHDGVEALDYLHRSEPLTEHVPRPLPALILLDLKLPRIDGLDVLRSLRADRRTRFVPVVVLTSSSEETDLQRSYALGCNAYVRKPMAFSQFTEAVHDLAQFWLARNELPASWEGADHE